MPSDDVRQLLKAFGVAVTTFEDAVSGNSSAEEILESEAKARARLQEVTALIDRLSTLHHARTTPTPR
jgi:hypothetical protein